MNWWIAFLLILIYMPVMMMSAVYLLHRHKQELELVPDDIELSARAYARGEKTLEEHEHLVEMALTMSTSRQHDALDSNTSEQSPFSRPDFDIILK